MKVKEAKNLEVITVRMPVYERHYKRIIEMLNRVGIGNTIFERKVWIMFKASFKQLLQLEEMGLFTFDDLELKIDCQKSELFGEED